ncbi:MAG: IS630 family transposase [bacterium]|nr:IS630 family transposase [bacterium]
MNENMGLWINQEMADHSFFSPEEIAQIKALACQLPAERGIPLSRFSITEIVREVISSAIVPSVSDSSVWRWLHEDAIRPWFHRSWIYPRDPKFIEKAGKVLDLYAKQWEGQSLGENDYVICADEKTSIQARIRKHPTSPPYSGEPIKVEHEYTRGGAWAYFAAWDVHRAKVFGCCEARTGIKPFNRLVNQVMSQVPYKTANRVFWVIDNGSSHRGQPFVNRLQKKWPNTIAVHLPVHASWLNQIEIYFAIVQRKVLTPNDFLNLQAVEKRLLNFQTHYQQISRPFGWKFTRKDLKEKLKLISNHIIDQYQPVMPQSTTESLANVYA